MDHSSPQMEEGLLRSQVKYLPPPLDNWNMANEMLAAFMCHSERTLLVDAAKRRSWTGRQLLEGAGSIATGLIRRVGLRPGQVVFLACDHSDDEILMALGVVLAGGAFYGACPEDGLAELKTLCELELPSVLVTNSRSHQLMADLRRSVEGLEGAPIVWLDDPYKRSLVEAAPTLNGAADANGNSVDSNNNNGGDEPHQWSKLMERDQVILATDLINGHYDAALVRLVADQQIDAQNQNLTYMLTSGSTGRPKVVANTHEELVHGLYSMISATKEPAPTDAAAATPHLLPLNEESVLAGDLPLDHGAGINTMLLSFSLGAKFIVMPAYEEDTFWRAVHEHRISSSIASTTFSYNLLSRLQALIHLGKHRALDLSCFRWLTCVGSKMAFGELVREINKTYPELRVCQGYGATEVGFITMLSTRDCRTHLNSVGHLFPGLVAKVVDVDSERGLVLGAQQRGELHVWARSKFKQYKCHREEDPQRLLAACHDPEGFYKTGDQVHYDQEGRLYVHGRFKDTLFLAQDWKILPSELEELVDQHPLVEQSAVLGVPDPQLPGCDAPRAFVRLISPLSKEFRDLLESGQPDLELLGRKLEQRDEQFIKDHIYQFVADRTAAAKHLRGGVFVLEEFPKVGLLNKVDRKALRLIK